MPWVRTVLFKIKKKGKGSTAANSLDDKRFREQYELSLSRSFNILFIKKQKKPPEFIFINEREKIKKFRCLFKGSDHYLFPFLSIIRGFGSVFPVERERLRDTLS